MIIKEITKNKQSILQAYRKNTLYGYDDKDFINGRWLGLYDEDKLLGVIWFSKTDTSFHPNQYMINTISVIRKDTFNGTQDLLDSLYSLAIDYLTTRYPKAKIKLDCELNYIVNARVTTNIAKLNEAKFNTGL